jgi:hypothetical protein
MAKVDNQRSHGLLGSLETVDLHDPLASPYDRGDSAASKKCQRLKNPRGSTVQGMRLGPIEILIPEKGPVF